MSTDMIVYQPKFVRPGIVIDATAETDAMEKQQWIDREFVRRYEDRAFREAMAQQNYAVNPRKRLNVVAFLAVMSVVVAAWVYFVR